MLDPLISHFKKFRDQLHGSFPRRKDALLELTDAIAGNDRATSVALLSLSALFSRQYSSLYDGVENFFSSYQRE